jgi:hypothetical protein
MSFRVKGTNVFQGVPTGVAHQMQNKYYSHLEDIHCMAHCTNMDVQTLFQIHMVKSIKDLSQFLYSFIFHNPKKHIEFLKLIVFMKAKQNKILHNVITYWINMLSPTKKGNGIVYALMSKIVKKIH